MPELPIVIFLLSAIPVFHTYVLYPAIMLAVGRRQQQQDEYTLSDDLPEVAVLIAAHNEEKVIAEKIVSVFNTSYPADKVRVFVGSDASVDATESLVLSLRERYSRLDLIRFPERAGKIGVINQLQSMANSELLIMTDANVIFTPTTLFELVRYFRDPRVGLVGAAIVKDSGSPGGIASQEIRYLSYENRIKVAESRVFRLVMGAEGGCYAIRSSLLGKVPNKFNVDDFFITMQVLLRGMHVLMNPAAVCVEDVPGDARSEFRRKVRISSGNFQNLLFFRGVLAKFWKPLGFTFWSHKVLRWLTPFFLIAALASSLWLAQYSRVFAALAALQVAAMLLPLADVAFNLRPAFLKFVSHFYLMNLALLTGFFRFVGGIRSSVWQPVERNV